MDRFRFNLADFYDGHPDDPLRAPPEFTQWRLDTAREQALFQRELATAAGPHTRMTVDGHDRDVLNFASLDYLGLNRHPDVVRAIAEAVAEWGSGACGVPILSGTTKLHTALERDVSELLGREATNLYASGFAGGTGLLGALLRKGDVAIADEKAHMCWVDGARMSGARLVTFAHGDPADLDRVLGEQRGKRRLVVVDGLYSMDGDLVDLPSLLDVCEAHGVGLIVDEAHSIFSIGERGGGVTEAQGMQNRVRLLFGTFSKTLSNLGGFVSGERQLLDYARLYGHPFVFSAALPPHVVAGIRAAMAISRDAAPLRQRLADNAAYFRKGLQTMGLDTGASTTHVIPVILGSQRAFLYESALAMLSRGLYVVPIDYPAVPEDKVRFRVSISAAHTRADLDAALTIFEDVVAVNRA